jgi:cyclophilin family peptidyl-prolyl cis-trans isomerase
VPVVTVGRLWALAAFSGYLEMSARGLRSHAGIQSINHAQDGRGKSKLHQYGAIGLVALIILMSVTCSAFAVLSAQRPAQSERSLLLQPDNPEMNRRAPEIARVRLETTKGVIRIELYRSWAPHGVDRFYNLMTHGYYDHSAWFRVIAGKWAQFGINGDPQIAQIWRTRTIADDARVESNVRGAVAFAFKDPNGRTTQVFINLRDNSAQYDAEPFVPIGKVIEGMNVADALYADYGEHAGGGIRAGKQDPIFAGGNDYLKSNFPRLDYILKATIEPAQ